MLFTKYEALRQDSLEDLSSVENETTLKLRASLRRARWLNRILIILLGLATFLLILTSLKLRNVYSQLDAQSYVGLQRDIVAPIPHDDRTLDDPMWDSPELNTMNGWVALDNEYVREKKLPTSMRWPWDSSKRIYVFHAFHSLHCVFVIRDSLRAYRDSQPQIWPLSHVTHCLHVLREDVLCAADDTPRYVGRLHAQANSSSVTSGIGQARVCRDWSQLRAFALEHSACYDRPLDRYVPVLERYKTCPDGSRPWEGVEEGVEAVEE